MCVRVCLYMHIHEHAQAYKTNELIYTSYTHFSLKIRYSFCIRLYTDKDAFDLEIMRFRTLRISLIILCLWLYQYVSIPAFLTDR